MRILPRQLKESFFEKDISRHQRMEMHFKGMNNGAFTRQF